MRNTWLVGDTKSVSTNFPGPAPARDHLRIAFLGPFGTFTEQAVWQLNSVSAVVFQKPVASKQV